MTSTRTAFLVPLTLAALALGAAGRGHAEPPPAGLVTALDGSATVVRATAGAPQPLRFRDPVFVHDRITTGDRSTARILLGGRGLITVREHSDVLITGVPGRTAIDIGRGRLALAVAKGGLAPGEVIEIRAPRAIAAVRGTVVIAEVSEVTVFTVLRGLVAVVERDAAGRPAGPPISLGARQAITFGGLTSPRPEPLTPAAARRITDEYRMAPRDADPTLTAVTSAVTALHAPHAWREVELMLGGFRDSLPGTANPAPAAGTAAGGTTVGTGLVEGATGTVSGSASTALGTPPVATAPAAGPPSLPAGPVPTVSPGAGTLSPPSGPAPLALPSAPRGVLAPSSPGATVPVTTGAAPSTTSDTIKSLTPSTSVTTLPALPSGLLK